MLKTKYVDYTRQIEEDNKNLKFLFFSAVIGIAGLIVVILILILK